MEETTPLAELYGFENEILEAYEDLLEDYLVVLRKKQNVRATNNKSLRSTIFFGIL